MSDMLTSHAEEMRQANAESEGDTMLKVVMPIRRRPGMSRAEFVDYYESNHRLIGEKYLRGYAKKYVRRYLYNFPEEDADRQDPEYDVLLEAWYPDEETFRAFLASIEAPDIAGEIAADEEILFDRGSMRMYRIEEYESEDM